MKRWWPALLPLLGPSCGKVPIEAVFAEFVVADVSWFEEEQTMFVFAEVQADQGIEDPSVVEIEWTTDDGKVEWTPISALSPVHTHVAVDCGPRRICTSMSVKVAKEPRRVHLRLRWHVDGELALLAPTAFNVVAQGNQQLGRSMVVYGVFDAENRQIQWRGRHTFPTIRNEQAQFYGLRRTFRVDAPAFGDLNVPPSNPYGYGAPCPGDLVPYTALQVGTLERAVFAPDLVPQGAAPYSAVCATSTVADALGEHSATAIARKNPEVKAAFPLLRSPIRDAVPLKFFLKPCGQTISDEHEAMQRQRLEMQDVAETCTDGWERADFVPDLVNLFRDAIDRQRPQGRDMVLAVAVHQDDSGVVDAVQDALSQVVPQERHRTTPRLAGAFVFDSTIAGPSNPGLDATTLWCPSTLPTADLPTVSQRSCAIAPDTFEIDLGPFSFGTLPILPSRDQYLDFIDTYSVRSAGKVTNLEYLTPEFAASARHVDLGEYGVVTFLNGETIEADADDAFSWCEPEEPVSIVFGSDILSQALYYGIGPEECAYLGLPPEDCEGVTAGVLPIDALPAWHDVAQESRYDLGVFWEFPFLLHVDYETFFAGAVSAFGFSVPFGVGDTAESFYGAAVWMDDELPLAPALIQCERWCHHPTFDSAGVYHPTDPFDPTYLASCYQPRFPRLSDDGFPLDP